MTTHVRSCTDITEKWNLKTTKKHITFISQNLSPLW